MSIAPSICPAPTGPLLSWLLCTQGLSHRSEFHGRRLLSLPESMGQDQISTTPRKLMVFVSSISLGATMHVKWVGQVVGDHPQVPKNCNSKSRPNLTTCLGFNPWMWSQRAQELFFCISGSVQRASNMLTTKKTKRWMSWELLGWENWSCRSLPSGNLT